QIQSYATHDGFFTTNDTTQVSTAGVLGYALIVMVFMLLTGAVFIAGAFLLISRFIALVILMVFSPIMFLGLVLPAFEKYSAQWRNKFVSHAFVAPAYLFMLYLALVTIQSLQVNGGFYSALNPNASGGFFIFFLFFVLIIGFVYAALVVAKQMSVFGATQALAGVDSARRRFTGGANSARRAAQGVAVRNTVGKIGAGTEKRFRRWQSNPDKLDNFSRRFVANRNLDRFVLGTAATAQTAKGGSQYSYKDRQDQADERQTRITGDATAQARLSAIDKGLESVEAAVTASAAGKSATDGDIAAIKDLGKAVGSLGEKQLTQEVDFSKLSKSEFAVHLDKKQLKQLEDSGRFSASQISQIKAARSDGHKSIAFQNQKSNGVDVKRSSAYNAVQGPEWLTNKG
ncbi:MAG: hypothetical protein AAFO91_14240, partial [Bacteroidota bacterium]